MKISSKLIVFVVLSGLLFSFGINQAFAHCGKCGVSEAAESETVTLQAKVLCLGCALKKGQGAKAQCSIYGHKNALKTGDGRIWSILENDVSTELINSHDYAGKTVEVTGRKLINAQVIEVESFKVIEEKKGE